MIVHKLIEYCTETGEISDAKTLDIATKFEIRGDGWLAHEVQDYAHLLLNSGLLRLPFRTCYFESTGAGAAFKGEHGDVSTVAALAVDDPSTMRVFLHFWGFSRQNGWSDPQVGGFSYDANRPGVLTGSVDSKDDTFKHHLVAYFVAYILAFMDVKETNLSDVVIKDRVNRHRIVLGKSPLYSHKVLTITSAAKDAIRVKGNAALIARRAHWRRGHLRHLPNKIVPVAPALVRGEGFVSKDYRI